MLKFSCSNLHSDYMEATLSQSIPSNTTSMDSNNLSMDSVPNTETPPPGYVSEDNDPMDQNDNMSELLVSSSAQIFSLISA